MKRYLIAALLAVTLASAQENRQEQTATVEHSGGIQTGLLGIWGYHEFPLSNSIALRAEAGFNVGVVVQWGGDDEDIYGLIPHLRLEPRWYYNLPKRVAKGYRTDGNSGNFLALNTTFVPDIFIGSSPEGLHVLEEWIIVPKWGIRRNLGNRFNYEAGIGIGYAKYRQEYLGDKGSVYPDLHLRLGYRF